MKACEAGRIFSDALNILCCFSDAGIACGSKLLQKIWFSEMVAFVVTPND